MYRIAHVGGVTAVTVQPIYSKGPKSGIAMLDGAFFFPFLNAVGEVGEA